MQKWAYWSQTIKTWCAECCTEIKSQETKSITANNLAAREPNISCSSWCHGKFLWSAMKYNIFLYSTLYEFLMKYAFIKCSFLKYTVWSILSYTYHSFIRNKWFIHICASLPSPGKFEFCCHISPCLFQRWSLFTGLLVFPYLFHLCGKINLSLKSLQYRG